MSQTNHGSIEWLRFPNPEYPGDNTKLIKKWLRDSWARRKIIALQQAIAAIVIPTKTSDLTNDSGFITSADIPPGAAASATTPKMDGTAAVGTENAFARGDHRHPTDTSRQAALSAVQLAAVNSGVTAAKVQAWDGITVPTKTSDLTNDSGFLTVAPVTSVNGKVGVVNLNASDVGALPSSTAIPSATSDLTNDSGFITASSVPSASSTAPAMDGTASAGSSTAWARGDHVHPHDTSKADKATTLAGYGITNAYTKTEVNSLIPTVPTNVSAFTNDAGYITSAPVASVNGKTGAVNLSAADVGAQGALTAAQMAAVDSGITADALAVNDASVLCTVTPIEPTLLEPCYHSNTYGRCWYYKIGHHVHLHVGISGLTSGTTADVFYLPEGYRPYSMVSNVGTGTSMTNYSRLRVATDGRVFVNANAASACVDIEFDAFQ